MFFARHPRPASGVPDATLSGDDSRRALRRELVGQCLAADGDCFAADGPIRAAESCCRCRADRAGEPDRSVGERSRAECATVSPSNLAARIARA